MIPETRVSRNREAVDALLEKARTQPREPQDLGFMYQRVFAEPDGNPSAGDRLMAPSGSP